MAQGSRQIQTQAQQQTQTLSPQQILAVKLLQLNTVELEERVRAELLENPALEEGKSQNDNDEQANENESRISQEDGGCTDYDSLSDYLNEDDIPDYKLQEQNQSQEQQAEQIPFADTTSFYETLKEQLAERSLNEHQRQLTEYLIGSLDDDGLLRKPLDSIADELAIYAGIDTTPDQLEEALHTLQDFDPAGLGARNLQECLLLQIDRKLTHNTPSSAPIAIAQRILTECYEEFTRKHWEKISQKLNIDSDTCAQAIKEIRRLNPRPGAALGETIGQNMQQIVPDFLIETLDDGSINIALNSPGIPPLRLSQRLTDMLEEHVRNKANQTKAAKEAMSYLKQKLDSARGFIDAIAQRQQTMMKTMQAIVDLQRPFFLHTGDEAQLKPMILKDVAARTGLDISTISRVTGSKYAQTDFGIYPLKYFFSDGYVTEDGEEMSVREIRKALKECIESEDKKKPYTDDELTRMMNEKGYPIARRTVAKYRQQLNIPVARLRK